MAQKIVLEVEHAGKIQHITVRPKTYKEYEKKYGCTITEFQQNPSATGSYWLAWHSLMLLGDSDACVGFEKWMDDLDAVEVVEEGSEHPKDQTIVTPDTSSN